MNIFLSSKFKVFVRPPARKLAEIPLIRPGLPVPPGPPAVMAAAAPRRQDDRRPADIPSAGFVRDVTKPVLPPPAQPADGGKRDAWRRNRHNRAQRRQGVRFAASSGAELPGDGGRDGRAALEVGRSEEDVAELAGEEDGAGHEGRTDAGRSVHCQNCVIKYVD